MVQFSVRLTMLQPRRAEGCVRLQNSVATAPRDSDFTALGVAFLPVQL
jgi:hypothetical protein